MNLINNIKYKLYSKFSFKKDNIKYYYKKFDSTNRPLDYLLNELVAYKMATKVGIKCVEPIVINKSNQFGMITKSFERKDYKTISGNEIIKNYYRYLDMHNMIDELDDDEELAINKLNNLEDIWDALILHFKDYKKRNDIVSKIMLDLTKIFSFEILMMQIDRHGGNWQVLESVNNEDAYLAPIYDNELCFSDLSFNNSIHTNYEVFKYTELSKNLKSYLMTSSIEFQNQFVEYFNILTPELLSCVIEEVNNENGNIFKYHYMQKVLDTYTNNYNKISEILISLNLIEDSNKRI